MVTGVARLRRLVIVKGEAFGVRIVKCLRRAYWDRTFHKEDWSMLGKAADNVRGGGRAGLRPERAGPGHVPFKVGQAR